MFNSRHVLCVNKHWYMCVLSHFSHIRLFVTLWTVAYQVPLSMVFSRQKYWSGLPFPSPGPLLQFSSVTKSCSILCDPMDYSPPGSSVHGILQAKILEWVAMSSSRESSGSRDQTHVSLAGEFFTTSTTWEALYKLSTIILFYRWGYQAQRS